MLLELERECLEVYRRKVDSANKSRAQLRQAIADAEAELASICSAMGERPVHIRQVKREVLKLCTGLTKKYSLFISHMSKLVDLLIPMAINFTDLNISNVIIWNMTTQL